MTFDAMPADKQLPAGRSTFLLSAAGKLEIRRPGMDPSGLQQGTDYEIIVGADGSIRITKPVTNLVDLGVRGGAPSSSPTADSRDGILRQQSATRMARISAACKAKWRK